MVQAVQLIPACKALRRVGRPVATIVPSSDDINRAIETMAKITQRDVLGVVAVLRTGSVPVASSWARLEGRW